MLPRRSKKLIGIYEKDIRKIIKEEYNRARKILYPLLKDIPYSKVTFYWYKNKRRIGGTCWKYGQIITLNRNYRTGEWSEDMMRLTLRHEIVHLIEDNHSRRFLHHLESVQGHRFVGRQAYIRDPGIVPD